MSRFGHGQTGGGGVRPREQGGGGYGGGKPGGYGGGERDRSQPDQTVAQHWPNYLQGGYFDNEGNLKIEYVSRCIPGDEVLEESKQKGLEALARIACNSSPQLNSAQVRRFFQHCRGIETKLKSGASWNSIRPQFQFLDSAAQDAHGKQPRKIPGLFFDFIRRNVAAVKTENDFLKGFLPHFEAFVGFSTPYLARERN
jgi:CRISPR/Cas system CSM-associated protein Csm2 small subunit